MVVSLMLSCLPSSCLVSLPASDPPPGTLTSPPREAACSLSLRRPLLPPSPPPPPALSKVGSTAARTSVPARASPLPGVGGGGGAPRYGNGPADPRLWPAARGVLAQPLGNATVCWRGVAGGAPTALIWALRAPSWVLEDRPRHDFVVLYVVRRRRSSDGARRHRWRACCSAMAGALRAYEGSASLWAHRPGMLLLLCPIGCRR